MEPPKVYDRVSRMFEISRHRVDKPQDMDLYHYHDVFEIYYLVSGRRDYFVRDRIWPVTGGELVLVNIADMHRTTGPHETPIDRILINFRREFVASVLQEETDTVLAFFDRRQKRLRLEPTDQTMVQGMLVRMLNEGRRRQPGHVALQRALLVELLIFISRQMARQPDDEWGEESALERGMADVASFLLAHHAESLSLSSVAERFFITPSHLSRSFRKVTGFTFIEYLNGIRIREAQKLLLETELPMTEIVGRTGFDSQTHFGRVFRLKTGLSPLRFRKLRGIGSGVR